MNTTNSNKMKMDRFLNQKKLDVINLVIVSYFISIYMIDLLKVNLVLVGVFKELLTIPFFGCAISVLSIWYNSFAKRKKIEV